MVNMKNSVVLFSAFIMLTACNIYCFSQGNYKHKSEDEIAAMIPAQRVDEFFKEQHYHNGDPVDKFTAGRDQGDII